MSASAARERIGRGAFLAITASLLLLGRVHQGLRHDARLYFGDALARLDPQGVGKDLIFAHDGQFGFSLYTPLLAKLVGLLGLDLAVRAVSLTGLALWLLALLALAERMLASFPVVWRRAAVVLVLAVPPYYGALEVFAFGEGVATPRVLVEAAAMAALAAWLADRRWTAFAILSAAMAVHPIMALSGLAVLFIALCLEDRRWLALGAAGLAVVVVGALAGLPIVERLFQVMDPGWRAFGEGRSPAVFTSQWPAEAWGRLIVHVATLGVASTLLEGRSRRLTQAVIIAGLLGVGAAKAADAFSLVLPLQLQLWRTGALLGISAALGLAVCARELPKRGAGGVMAVCALVVGWTYVGWGLPAVVAGGLAVLLLRLPETTWSRPEATRRIAVVVSALLVVLWATLRLQGVRAGLAGLPPEPGLMVGLVWNSGLPGWIAGAAAVALAARPELAKPPLAVVAALILAVLALAFWDGRTAHARWRDAGHDARFVTLLADRPGEVLWLGGDVEPWTLLGRPSWASRMQGAGVTLSRPLTVTLSSRIDRLIRLALADESWRRPQSAEAKPVPVPSLRQTRALCAAADAPAWIVAPLRGGEVPDPALNARTFTPRATYPAELGGRWQAVRAYAAIPCRGPSPASAR